MKIVKIIAVLVVLGLIVWGLSSLSGNKPEVSTGPVKIGIILPLSGDLASFGELAKDGAELALSNFKNTKHQYQLVFEDDQFTGPKTISAATKLISVDKVNEIVSFGSSGGNVVKPLATQNKIVHFAVASDPSIPDGKYNFNHWTPPSEEAKLMVQELKRRGINKIGLFVGNQQGMIAVSNELNKQLQNSGIEVVTNQMFNLGENDFRSLITKAKTTNPQIYVMITTSPDLEILATQMKEAKISTPMTSIESFDQTSKPELFAGDWYISASDPSAEFTDAFKQAYGVAPGFGTPNVYDIVSMLITATENTNSANPTTDQIAEQLKKISDFKGALGNLNIDSNGQVISGATVKTVKGN